MSRNRIILLFLALYIFQYSNQVCYYQANEGGSHEKWEFILEDTGDVLQMALPVAAGLTTVIKKDWKGTKQLVFHIPLVWQLLIC